MGPGILHIALSDPDMDVMPTGGTGRDHIEQCPQLGLAADATAEQIEAAIAELQAPAQALTACGFTAAELSAGAAVRPPRRYRRRWC